MFLWEELISCQQQARCLFHKELFFLWAYILSATGKMPIPQRVIFFGGLISCQQQARCLFHKELFFLGWIDVTNITFFQKGGKCGMM